MSFKAPQVAHCPTRAHMYTLRCTQPRVTCILQPAPVPRRVVASAVPPASSKGASSTGATTNGAPAGPAPKTVPSSKTTSKEDEQTTTVSNLYPPAQSTAIISSWKVLTRWSRRNHMSVRQNGIKTALDLTTKVVVFGGGSFGTAMGATLALAKSDLSVVLLLRDEQLCIDINTKHMNTRYLDGNTLPPNVTATTVAVDAIKDAQYAIHAVPVQSSREYLEGIKDVLPAHVPIVSVSKGIEKATGLLLSDVIPAALGREQECVFLSGPSFAMEVLTGQPTCIVAASSSRRLAKEAQELFGTMNMRITLSRDVAGLEICGALKNVLAIAAGVVEGQGLGSNALAAVVSQGCLEIRWLATAMGADPHTVAGLSGLGDIMLTCYGALSRNRQVGIRLGQGEPVQSVLKSGPQVAEGVATAGSVVNLANEYGLKLPVLTATASILNDGVTVETAVQELMNFPQLEESW